MVVALALGVEAAIIGVTAFIILGLAAVLVLMLFSLIGKGYAVHLAIVFSLAEYRQINPFPTSLGLPLHLDIPGRGGRKFALSRQFLRSFAAKPKNSSRRDGEPLCCARIAWPKRGREETVRLWTDSTRTRTLSGRHRGSPMAALHRSCRNCFGHSQIVRSREPAIDPR